MKRVRVSVDPHPYDVIVGRGVLDAKRLAAFFKPNDRGVVVSSRKVMGLHGARVLDGLRDAGFEVRSVITLKDGEKAKTVGEWERTMRAMATARLDRGGFVVALGGGSVGDAAGFAAATFMRGIRLVQIPTTLLSMVDSSVGGKTGLNLPQGKNLIGSFHQPSLVLADLRFLDTLPERERQSGVYEVLKCAILRDEKLLQLLERTRGLRNASESQVETAIAAAIRVKARIVERDERESGERILLNFGHTLGHALEAATSYRDFTHGEAVAYGMEFAVDLGAELSLTRPPLAARLRAAVASVGARSPLHRSMRKKVQHALLQDKKLAGAELKEVIIRAPQDPMVQRMNAVALAGLAGAWVEDNSPQA